MTLTAFILIFASVFLHALWHFISKKSNPSPAFFVIVSGTNCCMQIPFLLTSGIDLRQLPPEFYLVLFGGAFAGMVCDIGLAYAYRLADVSLAYPLARALPVLMTAFITILFRIGKIPSALALFGMAVITAGCIFMPMKNFSDLNWKNYWNKALGGIFIAALGTTAYTIFDSAAVRFLYANDAIPRWHSATSYSCMREMILSSMLVIYVSVIPKERAQLTKELFCQPHPYFAGVFAGLAYFLILVAMGAVTNVSFVQAFRQMSLPVGGLLGIIILKEKCPRTKLIGIILVVTGLIITALAGTK